MCLFSHDIFIVTSCYLLVVTADFDQSQNVVIPSPTTGKQRISHLINFLFSVCAVTMAFTLRGLNLPQGEGFLDQG